MVYKVARLLSILLLWDTGLLAVPAQEIRVGVILPLSGAVAPTGVELQRGLDFAVQEINRAGGIHSLGGALLKLVYADSRGLPETGMSEAERLILREKVSALLGAFQSSVTLTSSEVAERYHVPYLVLVSVAPSITQRGFHWVFRATETAEMDTSIQMAYLHWISRRTAVRPRTAAIVAENSEWGETSGDLTRKLLPTDIQVVLDERYSPGGVDFTTLAQKLRQTHPDVIFLASYVSDGILITRALVQQGVQAMAILTRGAEHGDPAYRSAVGDLGDYQTWMVPFHPAQAKRQPWMEPILAEYRRRCGQELSPFAAAAYANVYILRDALERTTSLNAESIREALARTHLTRGPAMLLPYPVTEFDSSGQNPHTTLPLVQTVRGVDYIVYPRELADPEFQPVYPLSGWPQVQSLTAGSAFAPWLQAAVSGLLNGGMYALFALGLSLVFGVMRVVNFAHGSMLMLGMFAAYGAWRYLHLSPYVAVLFVCPLLFAFGYAIQSGLLNRLLEREGDSPEPASPLLLTLGLALVLDNAALLLFGADYRLVRMPSYRSLVLGGLRLDQGKLVVLFVAVAVLAGLTGLLLRTQTGLSLRAVAQDREVAALQGIDSRRTYSLAFGLGAGTVGLAACLIAPFQYAHPSVGLLFLIKGFLVVVLGGMGSLAGTFGAALLVGVLEAVIGQRFTANFADAAVFVLFITFLLFSPQSLFRRARMV